jgi:hypothetical protein
MQNNFTEIQNFNIEPNKQIWVDIEKQLPPEKKRRIVGWWWRVPILLSLAGVGLYNHQYKTQINSIVENQNKINQFTKNASQTDHKKVALDSKKNALNVKQNIEATANSFSQSKAEVSLKKQWQSQPKQSHKKVNFLQANTTLVEVNKAVTNDNNLSLKLSKNVIGKQVKISKLKSNNNLAKAEENYSKIESKVFEIESKEVEKFGKKNNIDSAKKNNKSILNSTANNTSIDSSLPKIKISIPKKISWHLVAGFGANYVSKNTIVPNFSSETYAASPQVIGVGLSGGLANYNNKVLALPQTGFAGNVGIKGKYLISKKSALLFGLEYNFLQTSLNVNPLPIGDIFDIGNMQSTKNIFHLLSVPISYMHCFTPNKKYKFSIFAGANIDFAFAQNSLFINDNLGFYQSNTTNKFNTIFGALHTGISINCNDKFSVDILAKKYLSAVQKISAIYYWQQVNVQINIPFATFKK